MAADRNGALLSVGDHVTMDFVITSIKGETGANVNAECFDAAESGEYKPQITGASKLMLKGVAEGMAAVEGEGPMSIGGGGKMGTIGWFLKNYEKLLPFIGLFTEFKDYKGDPNTVPGMKGYLDIIRRMLETGVKFSDTPVDDQVVGVIGNLLGNDQLIALLVRLLQMRASGQVAAQASMPQEEAQFSAAGIPWASLMQLLPLLLELFQKFRKPVAGSGPVGPGADVGRSGPRGPVGPHGEPTQQVNQ